ncbi:lysophospholipid acyltransferase family protein [Croceicoccus mobilis]|uniref:1-acyl-sn-glycerol-3-phosphate acyltransferase n=1 Tax=Croceicoccus mobilis TaxID=1703339 RepID=A0A916Z244_9SPHN|nr:lysophospholipid acyltransferase family protein [Croceicoccus mobilis]GGD72084.1 1-acyl-sn-glycerol-3-phosphate acyltransferase [Croceicoccus mobilis]
MARLRTLLFSIFFYTASVLLVVIAMPIGLVSRRGVIAAATIWCRIHRWCVRWLLGVRIRIEGELHDGQAMYALRHESFFEAIDLPIFLPTPPIIFAKMELLRIPLWGWLAARYGIVGVERGKGASALRTMRRAALAAKESGRDFAIFPEGTRVRDNEAPEMKAGLYGIYRMVELPLVPVAVDSGRLYQQSPKRAGTITYRIGKAIEPGLPRNVLEAEVHAAINALNPAFEGQVSGDQIDGR